MEKILDWFGGEPKYFKECSLVGCNSRAETAMISGKWRLQYVSHLCLFHNNYTTYTTNQKPEQIKQSTTHHHNCTTNHSLEQINHLPTCEYYSPCHCDSPQSTTYHCHRNSQPTTQQIEVSTETKSYGQCLVPGCPSKARSCHHTCIYGFCDQPAIDGTKFCQDHKCIYPGCRKGGVYSGTYSRRNVCRNVCCNHMCETDECKTVKIFNRDYCTSCCCTTSGCNNRHSGHSKACNWHQG